MQQFQSNFEEHSNQIIFLGAHAVGKSTIYRHLLWNYGNGKELVKNERTVKEHVRFVLLLHRRFINSIFERYGTTGNVNQDNYIKGTNICDLSDLTEEYATFVHELWMSARGQEVWKNKDKYGISESLEYFCREDTLQRMLETNYQIAFQDFIRGTSVSTGISEAVLSFKSRQMIIAEVGGRVHERKRWIYPADSASAVIFVVALDDFTRTLVEDDKMSRWVDDLHAFKIAGQPWLQNKPMIVIFTKLDVFHKKLKEMEKNGENLDKYFPDLALGTNYDTASLELIGFMEHQIKCLMPEKSRSITCFINAVNPETTAKTLGQCLEWLQSVPSATSKSNVSEPSTRKRKQKGSYMLPFRFFG